MYNPLLQPLSDFNDEQLSEKIRELTRKYYMTSNPYLRESLSDLLFEFTNEQTNRLLNKDTGDEDFDDYISVN